jgi:hypothetical protein
MDITDLQEYLAPKGVSVKELDNKVLLYHSDKPPNEGLSITVPTARVVPFKKTEQTCIIIAGLPRSGTSCIAGVCHHLGVEMGPLVGTISPANPTGFFENESLVSFHQEFTGQTAETEWRTVDQIINLTNDQLKKYTTIVNKLQQAPIWGFKDLRWYCFAHHLAPLLRGNIKILEVTRHFGSTRESMLNYPGFEEAHQGEIEQIMFKWYQAKSSSISELMKYHHVLRLIVPYEMLLAYPKKTIQQIALFIGVNLTQEAIDFVQPELNHYGS